MSKERDLIRLLERALAQGRWLSAALDMSDRERELVGVQSPTPARVRGCVSDLDRNLRGARALAGDLAAPYVLPFGRARGRARTLVSSLDRDRTLATDILLAFDRGGDLDRDRLRALTRALGRELDRARVVTGFGVRHRYGDLQERPVARAATLAVRIATVATRLLPAVDRARYDEEYHSELWELAAAGKPRGQQIRCALRQFRCAVPLRFVVLAPRRRKASP
jgi:hypothetical protein